MLKSYVLAVFYMAVVSATYRNDFGNFIEYYDEVPLPQLQPYAHQDNTLHYGQVLTASPVLYTSNFEHVHPPIAAPVAELRETSQIYHNRSTFSLGKSLLFFIIKNAPALIFGFLAVIGVCTFTPICSNMSNVRSLSDVHSDLIALVTPERLHVATEFVKEALRKYRSLQES